MNRARKLLLVAALFSLGQVALGQELSERDRVRAAVQEICPVSGNRLGSHGTPIKAQVGQETVFLCCQACLKEKINPSHWATIHSNFARAQGVCPVRNHKLPPNAKSTVVQGQIIYVCCPPCIQQITEQPQMYLRRLDELYAASLRK